MNGLRKALLYWNTAKGLKPVQLEYQIKKRICSRERKQKQLIRYVRKLEVPQSAAEIKILIPELDCDERYLGRFDTDGLLNDEVTLLHETHRIWSDEDVRQLKSGEVMKEKAVQQPESGGVMKEKAVQQPKSGGVMKEKAVQQPKFGGTWNVLEASHLWNYNLHYLEFLIPLAAAYADTGQEKYFLKWKQLAGQWMKQSFSSVNDSLEPYTISMRIPNLLISLELLEQNEDKKKNIRNTGIKSKLLTSIYRQYRYLLCTQELALLANHYLENLKTIIISSLLFGELDIYHKYFDLFLKQAEEQILPDGIHFERSMMYHKIILEDFLRVYSVLYTSGHPCDAEKLLPAVRAMAQVLADFEQGFGCRTPLFNDAGNNVSKESRQLLNAVRHLPYLNGYRKGNTGKQRSEAEPNLTERENRGRKGNAAKRQPGAETYLTERKEQLHHLTVCNDAGFRIFKDAGYYQLQADGIAVLFDCGDIGPSYMGGHGHCDCLSFELSADTRCMFVNSGTGCYQGEHRTFFRSTKAHNTVMTDDREQAELWGGHRAGRRMTHIRGYAEKNMLAGQFRSYLGDFFNRTIKWEGSRRTLVITDKIQAGDRNMHTARQFFHLAPEYRYQPEGNRIFIMDGTCKKAVMCLPKKSRYRIHRNGEITLYAEDFGRYEKKQVLEVRTRFAERIRLQIEITMEPGLQTRKQETEELMRADLGITRAETGNGPE